MFASTLRSLDGPQVQPLGPDTSARSAKCGGMGEEACQGESGPFDWNARTRRRNSSMHPLSSPPRSTSAWPGETSGERGENVVALLNGSHSGMIALLVASSGLHPPVRGSASRAAKLCFPPNRDWHPPLGTLDRLLNVRAVVSCSARLVGRWTHACSRLLPTPALLETSAVEQLALCVLSSGDGCLVLRDESREARALPGQSIVLRSPITP